MCLPTSSETPAVEIAPPNQNNQGLVIQEILKPTRGADGQLIVKLDQGVSLKGKVYASDDATKLIPARIVAYRDSLIAGRPRVQIETSTEFGKRDTGKEGFVLWLNKRHTYTFLVYPLTPYDYDYPPHVETLEVNDHLDKDFVFDGPDRAVIVKGRVLDYTGKALVSKVDISGYKKDISTVMRIRAFETGGLDQSTVSKTDPKSGEFAIKVPAANPGSYTIKVDSAVDSVPLPTLECSKIILGIASSQQQNPQPTQVIDGPILLPSFLFPKLYKVKVTDADGGPVLGATVTFAAELKVLGTNKAFDSCKATYERSGLTDATGTVELLLMPGGNDANQNYDVTVRSPASSQSASRWVPALEVGPNAGTLAPIVLAPRHKLAARVVGSDQRPVAGVLIEASGIISSTSASKLPVTSASAISNDQGDFEIHMDPGTYNLELRPPQGSGLPSFGKTIKVEQSMVGTTDFVVPAARVLPGRVTSWDGKTLKPLSQAMVRIYDLVPKSQHPVTHTATLRASSITDGQGQFSLIVDK